MNLQECKDRVARKWKFKDWQEVENKLFHGEMDELWNEAMKLYATEKVKEALSEMLKRGSYVSAKATHDLETEIINSINNE